jgi:hypothetical protein
MYNRNLAIWHGTDLEQSEFLAAITHNCTCVVDEQKKTKTVCAPHEAMVHNQDFLNKMLFMRRMRGRLLKEEYREKVK